MKIGLRTVKTAISAALAMIIAEKLGLLYAPSAGIISVLSVTSTKKTSVMTGIYRLLSLALATILAYICFTFFGFYSDCFWYFFVIIYSSSCVFSII
ncbi:aromatic acid exporter family protein [Enterococcus faecalis ATCC 29212]